MIIGIGTDLVDIRRIEKAVERQPERFLKRVFTAREIAQVINMGTDALADRRRVSFLAKRFATKEAVLKALGTGLRDGLRWRDIEVRNDAYGAPLLKLYGKAQELAEKRMPEGKKPYLHLSLADEYPYAKAYVIIEAR